MTVKKNPVQDSQKKTSGLTAFWRLGSSTGASGSRCYDSQKKTLQGSGLTAFCRLGSSTGASGSRCYRAYGFPAFRV